MVWFLFGLVEREREREREGEEGEREREGERKGGEGKKEGNLVMREEKFLGCEVL